MCACATSNGNQCCSGQVTVAELTTHSFDVYLIICGEEEEGMGKACHWTQRGIQIWGICISFFILKWTERRRLSKLLMGTFSRQHVLLHGQREYFQHPSLAGESHLAQRLGRALQQELFCLWKKLWTRGNESKSSRDFTWSKTLPLYSLLEVQHVQSYTEQEEQGFKTGPFPKTFISGYVHRVREPLSVLALCCTEAIRRV